MAGVGIAAGEVALLVGALLLAGPDSPGAAVIMVTAAYCLALGGGFFLLRGEAERRRVLLSVFGASLLWGLVLGGAGFLVYVMESGWGAVGGLGALGLAYGMMGGAVYGLSWLLWPASQDGLTATPLVRSIAVGLVLWVVVSLPDLLSGNVSIGALAIQLPIAAALGALAGYAVGKLLHLPSDTMSTAVRCRSDP